MSQLALMVKSLPANAGDRRDVGSLSGSGRRKRGTLNVGDRGGNT